MLSNTGFDSLEIKEANYMTWVHGLAVMLVPVLIGGCAPTQQASQVKPSGFLGDYSKLHRGGKGDPSPSTGIRKPPSGPMTKF